MAPSLQLKSIHPNRNVVYKPILKIPQTYFLHMVIPHIWVLFQSIFSENQPFEVPQINLASGRKPWGAQRLRL
jgi:hypothetical protein